MTLKPHITVGAFHYFVRSGQPNQLVCKQNSIMSEGWLLMSSLNSFKLHCVLSTLILYHVELAFILNGVASSVPDNFLKSEDHKRVLRGW